MCRILISQFSSFVVGRAAIDASSIFLPTVATGTVQVDQEIN
jgi:hypothetical protein